MVLVNYNNPIIKIEKYNNSLKKIMLVKAMFDENDYFYSITDIEMMGRTGENI